MNTQARLLDMRGIAEAFSLPVGAVRELVRNGCPCCRVGRRLLFDVDEVDVWLRDKFERTPLPSRLRWQVSHLRAERRAATNGAPDGASAQVRERVATASPRSRGNRPMEAG